jgi:hypothetical protein
VVVVPENPTEKQQKQNKEKDDESVERFFKHLQAV